MTEERNLLSVDLGEVCSSALDELCKITKRTKSEVVRDSIIIAYHFGLAKDFNALRTAAEELSKGKHTPRTKSKMTPAERDVIKVWRTTFNYTGRIHYPAVLSAIRAAAKSLDHETICDIIELSPNNSFIASLVSKGEVPQIPMILGEKMLPSLLTYAEQVQGDKVQRDKLELEGHIKPIALAELREALYPNMFSMVYDMIEKATSVSEVQRIRKLAMEKQLDVNLDELKKELGVE